MRSKVRNLGFSLVELIVAFAILGVATLGVGSFFIAATRNSSITHEQSGLYNETQLASNQLENMIQKAELAICYRSDGTFVKQDTNPDATEKVFYIFNASATGNVELVLLKWDKNTSEINYKEITTFNKEKVAEIDIESADTTWALLAEDVSLFSVKMDEQNHKVFLDVKFGDDSTYRSSQTITLRNKVLFNPEKLSEVTEKITVNVESEITEVKINVSPKILAPGASVNANSEVFGSGVLPAYTTKWIVAKDFAMNQIVGDSSIAGSAITVDVNGVLSVKFNDDLEKHTGPLYVQAIAISDEQTVKSNIEELKIIQDMEVQVKGSDVVSSLTNPLPQSNAFQASSGVQYRLSASIIGNSLSVFEQNIKWGLKDVAAGVNATISDDGVLSIDKYSYGGHLTVVATLAKNESIKVMYPFYVNGSHSEGARLSIIPTTQSQFVNRGGEVGFNVSFSGGITSGQPVKAEDCNWSVVVKQGESIIGTDAVTVGTSGIVSVKESLPFGSTYTIEVTATLKKDETVVGQMLNLTVPRVSVAIERPSNASLKRGEAIDLKCTVTGLENYQLDWSMARSLKPNYFFGVLGDTSISVIEKDGADYGRVILGKDEPIEVTHVKLQAELVGHPAYSDSLKIDTLAELYAKVTQDNNSIATDGTGVIKKNTIEKTFWGGTREKTQPFYLSFDVENGDSSKLNWKVTGNGVQSYSFLGYQGYQVKNSGGGEVIIYVTYEGVPEWHKEIKLTAN